MLSDIIRSKYSKSRTLSIMLVLWVYTYALFYFVPLIISSNTMLMYIWLVGIDIVIILNNRYLSARIIVFLFVYVAVALINIMVVSYQYYVAIDAFSGLAVFLPAILIIGSSKFDLEEFLSIWYKFAIFATIFSPVAIILMQKRTIDYGVFTYLNLPNCIVFSYTILSTARRDGKRRFALILATINFLIILFFGGRMAAFVGAFSVFLAYMLSSFVNHIKKWLLIIVVGLTSILVINNLYTILMHVQTILNRLNLSSRSFSLLAEQIEISGASIYMTGRNTIYKQVLNYIVQRTGLPGGFGVSLHISNGRYYHPHNLFLQLAVMFGVIGGGFVILLLIYKVIQLKRIFMPLEYQFTLLLILSYIIISFTGGSILNNYVAIMGIGMIFFYRTKEKKLF